MYGLSCLLFLSPVVIKEGEDVDWISAGLRHFSEPLGRKNESVLMGFS